MCRLSDTGDLVRLYCIVHPASAIAQWLQADPTADVLSLVKVGAAIYIYTRPVDPAQSDRIRPDQIRSDRIR